MQRRWLFSLFTVSAVAAGTTACSSSGGPELGGENVGERSAALDAPAVSVLEDVRLRQRRGYAAWRQGGAKA